MHRLILALFISVTAASFLAVQFPAARLVKFMPEAISVVVLLYVAFTGTRRRFELVAPKYWLVFAALALVIVCGIASNDSPAPPIIAGVRFYLRAMPLFLLPAVAAFSESELRQQLKWLMWIGLAQLPVAVYQRWNVWQMGRFTGDPVQGTVVDSGVLTILLLSMAFVTSGLFLRGQLGRLRASALLLAFFIPTTINETKVTAIYVPIGMLVVMIVGADPRRRLRFIAWGTGVTVIFTAIFLPIYSYFEARNPYVKLNSVTEIFADQKKLDRYLNSNVKGVGTKKDVRRGDAIRVPFEYLANDPIQLTLGLGIGSVSPSTLGKGFEGRYYALFRPFLVTSLSSLLLEIGILGCGLVLILHWFVFQDALVVSRLYQGDSVMGGLAAGWTAVAIILPISLVYTPIHMAESVSYLFWYFSGILAAERKRISVSIL